MQDSSHDQRRLYSDLAWMWRCMSPPAEYAQEAEEFIRAIRQHSQIEPHTLLNLGCGGGHTDYWLKQQFDVTGIDQSESMLALARDLNPEIAYCLGDLRTIRLGETFDAVMAADSLAYMLTESDLRAAFMTAFVHLKPGGVFCTYVETTPDRFKQNATQCWTNREGNVEIAFIQNDYDPNPHDSTFETTLVYLIRRAGKLDVEIDGHVCGIFKIEVWQNLLQSVGFEVKQAGMVENCPLLVGFKSR